MTPILKFDLTFAVTGKKIDLAKEKGIQNKNNFFVHFWAERTHYDFIPQLHSTLFW